MTNFRRTIKKIAALGASVSMVGMTLMGASAATYPAPFVVGGAQDVAIVYGASGSDLSTVTDIATNLGALVTVSSSGTLSLSGEKVLLEKPSDKINLNDTVSGVFGTTIDKDDLPTLLSDGIYTNDENTEYDYDQKLTLGGGLTINFFASSDYKGKAPSTGLNLSSTHVVMNYTVNFNDQPESDVSGGELVDFETTTLKLLGKNYFVLDADNATNHKFTLLDSADEGMVAEGETISVSIGGKKYDVQLAFISSSEVKFNVNGEVTNSLAEGGTHKLSDGAYLGVKDITSQDYQGGSKNVEFSIGSGKLELTSGSAVKLNDNTVNEVTGFITKGTGATSGKERLASITLEWKTDEKEFVADVGDELELPGFGGIKIISGGFNTGEIELFSVQNSGSDVMEVSATLKDGEVTFPILYGNSSGEFTGIGESSTEELLTSFGITGLMFNDTTHDFVVGSWNNTKDAESYLFRFSDFSLTDGVNKTTVERYADGSWEAVCSGKSDSGGTASTCDIGSLTLTLNSINAATSKGGKYVNFTGNAGSSFYRMYTQNGLEVNLPVNVAVDVQGASVSADGAINLSNSSTFLPGHTQDTFFVVVAEENKDGDLGIGAQINITVDDQSDGDLEVAGVTSSRSGTEKELEDDENIQGRAESDHGSLYRRVGSSSVQRSGEVHYGDEQAFAEIYVASESVLSEGGTTTSNGIMSVKDSEFESVKTKNIIVVGASCANTVAADYLGSATPLCGADFTAKTGVGVDQWFIETFANKYASDKVVTLVGGWEAKDTKAAADALAGKDMAVGKKITSTDVLA